MSTNEFYKTANELAILENDSDAHIQLRFHALHTDFPSGLSTAESIILFQYIDVDTDQLPYENEYDGDVTNLRQLLNQLGDLNDDTMLDWISANYFVENVRPVFDYYLERNS